MAQTPEACKHKLRKLERWTVGGNTKIRGHDHDLELLTGKNEGFACFVLAVP